MGLPNFLYSGLFWIGLFAWVYLKHKSVPFLNGINKQNALIGVALLGLIMTGAISGFSLTSVSASSSSVGDLSVILSDGYANVTTTEDYLNDAKNVMEFYSADANIADGEEYKFNATIERTNVEDAGSVIVICQAPDKELSGTTYDNLIEKTAGQIDLDINDGGKYLDDNTVSKQINFAVGVSEAEIEIAFDQEEDYHDTMQDMQDAFYVNCKADDVPFQAIVKANS